MHQTALENMQRFIDVYGEPILKRNKVRVLELGSGDVNGTFRHLFPDHVEYIGLDIEDGPGVDVALSDPYVFPENLKESFDIAICSSCFEHAEMFWLSFIELLKTLKPDGVLYINAPSVGKFHRHPTDCWRFYPDCGIALTKWAKRSGLNSVLLESYITVEQYDIWNDYVGVFVKDEKERDRYPNVIITGFQNYINGLVYTGNNHYQGYGYNENMREWSR